MLCVNKSKYDDSLIFGYIWENFPSWLCFEGKMFILEFCLQTFRQSHSTYWFRLPIRIHSATWTVFSIHWIKIYQTSYQITQSNWLKLDQASDNWFCWILLLKNYLSSRDIYAKAQWARGVLSYYILSQEKCFRFRFG